MRFLALVIVLLVAAAAYAGGDIKCTADTTLSLTTGLNDPAGPTLFDLPANGTAYLKFVWFKSNATARDGSNVADTYTVFVRDWTPPRSLYFPSSPDSVKIDLGTATELFVVTPR